MNTDFAPSVQLGRGSKGPRTKRAASRARRARCHDCGGFMATRGRPECPACGCRRIATEDWPW